MVTIGKLAARTAVSVDTVRYYEREGLLRPAKKSAAGYRLYDDDAERRIRFIKQAQQCGFSLSETRDLLDLRRRDDACCSEVRTLAIEKKMQLEHKIAALRRMSETLNELIVRCTNDSAPLEECPILDALETSMSKAAGASAPRRR